MQLNETLRTVLVLTIVFFIACANTPIRDTATTKT
jgi:hypothetical protein